MRIPSRLLAACLLALLTGMPARADIPVPGETREQAAARRARQWQMRMEAEQAAQRAAQGQPAQRDAADQAKKAQAAATVPLIIEGIGSLADSRLVLPRKLIANLQASLNPGGGGGVPPAPGGLLLRTVLAGVALSLALAWVGLRLTRSPRRLGLVGVGALMVCAVVLGTGCPPRNQPVTGETYRPLDLTLTRDGKLCGEAFVELADSEEGVVLQVPRERTSQFVTQSGLKTEFAP
jgi:hypothetical protein